MWAARATGLFNMQELSQIVQGFSHQNGILFNHEAPRRGPNFVTNKIFRWPAEVDPMGRSIESEKVKLGWTPKVTFNQLVKIMVNAKLQAVEKG